MARRMYFMRSRAIWWAGTFIAALLGVAFAKYLALPLEISGPLVVATAIALMHLTNTMHPPGGATALIALFGGPKIQALGFSYAFFAGVCRHHFNAGGGAHRQ